MNFRSFRFVILFFLVVPFAGYSQSDDYDWGDDIVTAKGKFNVLQNELKSNNFDMAGDALFWLLNNAPKLNVGLYQRASVVYEAKEELAKTDEQKKIYQDSALWVYDKRLEYFGDEANVINLKGRVAWKYLRGRKGTHDQLFALYTRIYNLNKDSIYPNNARALMYLSCKEFKKEGINEQQLQQIFINISNTLDYQISNSTGATKNVIQKILSYVEQLFLDTIELTCDDVVKIFGQNFKETGNANKAKRLKSLLIEKKCLTHPVLIESMIIIEKYEPSAGGSMSIAKSFEKTDQLDSAIKYFEIAAKLSRVPSQQGEIYMELANIFLKKGRKSEARAYCWKAINSGQRVTEAYNFIGNLYFNSYATCKSGDVVEERAVFIAAYNMYEKAGNTEMMSRSKQQFPSMEDIFNKNLEVGDEFKVGCWINETVKLKNR